MSKLNCIDCRQEFEPKYWDLLETKILRGQGRCPDCRMRYVEEYEAKELAKKQAEVMRRRRDARVKMGIPHRYMHRDFGTFEKGRSTQIDKAYDNCWKYAEEYPIGARPVGYRSLLLYSKSSWGVGKTHLSLAIAHRLLDRWDDPETRSPSIVWVSEPDLYARIQASFNYTYEEKQLLPNEDDIIKELITKDLLILDDVGKEKRNDPKFVQRTLFRIINGRYNADLPMVITANLTPEELIDHFGSAGADEASWDRFYEMTGGKKTKLDGDSYRRLHNESNEHRMG